MARTTAKSALVKAARTRGAQNAAPPDEAAAKTAKTARTASAKPAAKKSAAAPAAKLAQAAARTAAKSAAKSVAKPARKAAAPTLAKPAAKAVAAPARAQPAPGARPTLVRDSFTMPEQEYAVLGAVKQACLKAGFEVKKSELLRVGVALLGQLDIASLRAVLGGLPQLRTGRPPAE